MAGEVVIDAPPALPRRNSASPLTRLLPLVMVVAMAGIIAVYLTSGAAATRGPASMLFPIMMAMSAVGTAVYSLKSGGRSGELHRDRCEYLRYLDGIDTVAGETARSQWLGLHAAHPEPGRLWTVAGGEQMWRRRPDDPQFCEVRIGVGEQPLSTRLVAADADLGRDTDPVTASALAQLIRRRSTVAGMPVTVNLRGLGHVTVGGQAETARALLRAVICQLATAHSPRHVRIAAVLDVSTAGDWDWLKWLAHHWHPDHDGERAALRFRTLAELPAPAPPVHTVVIVDSATAALPVPGAGVTLVTVVVHSGIDTAELHLDLDAEVVQCGGVSVRPDQLTREQAVTCARRLARYRAAPLPDNSGWLQLIGVDDLARIDPPNHWPAADPLRFLRVPVGRCEDGTPVHLDLKEAAHDGMGPHGLCVGATGSGKSEFLRTLVLGLITTHPPEALNLVLVDFKGGATFLGLHRTRHVSALITNLAEEAQLVARMADALAGEMTRRQELLRAAGNLANIAEYRRRTDLPALPALLIVVDEFSELLQQHPDFAELFVAIGRLGRSLGMHMLLASQRLDEGRLRGLESHLSYRVCLKTFSPNESRSVLGVADAYELPNSPGAAYLKTPSGEIIRFQTAFVSAAGPVAEQAPRSTPAVPTPRRFAGSWTAAGHRPSPPVTSTVLQQVVDRLAGRGTPAHQVWLPPLPQSVPLSDVLLSDPEPLTVAIGLVDRPFEQRRDRLMLVLGAGQGNVAIVGGPQSGKSTAAKTLAVALAATHHPHDVQLYCLDFGGGALSALQALPHVGTVAGRGDADLVRRTVAELHALVSAREARFTTLGIGSMPEYRARRRAGDFDDPFGDVFLIIDGWSTFRGEFESLEPSITALAVQGLSLGVHVVATASRWAEFRPAFKDQLGTRIELRLGDPAESEMDRKRARQLGQCAPGRGLTREGRELLITLPRLDGTPSDTGIGAALARVGETLRAQYGTAEAPAVRLLPARVHAHELGRLPRANPATEVLLGLGERELDPVLVDFAAQPDLVILGDTGCGKSTVLRTVCRDLVTGNDPASVQLLIVDFRRALLGAVESEHLAGYAASAGALDAALPALLETLRTRMPGVGVTQRQLRDRSWWMGPELYVVVDDYDLVAGGGVNQLAPLLDYLPHARDLGLHLLVARRSGGAARAMFDPVLATVRDLGCMGLMMSASPDDGVLLGSTRPVRLPPGRGTLITRAAPDQLVQVTLPEGGAVR
ncbi:MULTISPECIES: type VII secretion protein EccCb [unclassified Mycolicibacterium]|uniref:type VII secretion protein EccCb n=1 Tax=unclassified Mycolicibacterium TaxID=2636767 RepID=UPI0012DE3170|nr:type VII secretion protein EccCb [Mycolicibacterium sp. CBMA 329]MUL87118.1 type VII secretion protein EccCb [Mycolicibacterium sp. CBMA 331]MUL98600.1 type VII secretion protein EccCb [Mycolicibacterium sp. CBMA 334]MUM28334.1 type VII secretion protein EccCb [Mycolicibacterium sp. CBMA 295]MUM37415.1 type VII secretion protein EccCb [Mycolicibacterium sp. CBMA 247]MUM43183.1 type VII secretion protein EccCb [Mycolicibacterium sp. CBMA 294]